MTTKTVPLAAVIGSPIAHSRSPRLYRHWLQTYGIVGYYIPMDIQASNLREVLNTLPKMGFKGVNVTLPHKESALSIADRVSDRAALIGAANTLTFQPDGTIHADNTDGIGFLENLRSGAPGWNAKDGPALVLGAGGAARAIIASLIDAGASEIRIANRTRVKADLLRDAFGPRVNVVDWNNASKELEDVATIINTTTLGMEGQAEFKVSLETLNPEAVANDLVYTPLETGFLKAAAERGCQTVDGLGMLLHQAVPGFERWFGVRPKVTDELRAAALA